MRNIGLTELLVILLVACCCSAARRSRSWPKVWAKASGTSRILEGPDDNRPPPPTKRSRRKASWRRPQFGRGLNRFRHVKTKNPAPAEWPRGVFFSRVLAPLAYFFFGGTIASFTALATRNFTTFLAGILIASPVAGLRPMRALRSTRTSRPMPGRHAHAVLLGLLHRQFCVRDDQDFRESCSALRRPPPVPSRTAIGSTLCHSSPLNFLILPMYFMLAKRALSRGRHSHHTGSVRAV